MAVVKVCRGNAACEQSVAPPVIGRTIYVPLNYPTIRAASDVVQAGDTVVVSSGTFDGFQNTTAGLPGLPIIYQIATGATVVINSRAPDYPDNIHLQDTPYVIVDGFTCVGGTGVTGRNVALRGATWDDPFVGCTLRNLTCSGAGAEAIYVSQFNGCLLEDFVITSAGGGSAHHGVYIANAGSKGWIVRRGNISGITGSGSQCIHMNGDASLGGDGLVTGWIIEDTICRNSATNALNGDGVQNGLVRNVLAYNIGRHGFRGYQGDGAAGPSGIKIVNSSFDVDEWAVAMSHEPGDTPHTLFNNELFGALGSVAVTIQTLKSNHNTVDDAASPFSVDGRTSTISLATWRSWTGEDADSDAAAQTDVFTDPANDDYSKKSGTNPSVDSGVSSFNGVTAPTTDLAGDPRTVHDRGCYERIADPAAAASGTHSSKDEDDWVAGGLYSLTDVTDTALVSGAAFDAARQAVLDGYVSRQSETTGFNAEIRAKENTSSVSRVSETQLRVDWTAAPSFDITTEEQIDQTLPASVITTSNALSVTPVPIFTIAPVGGQVGDPVPDAYMATDGSNGGTGSKIDPWLTFDYAQQQIANNETVGMLPGTYNSTNGALVAAKHGASAANPITFIAENDGAVVIDGEWSRVPLQLGYDYWQIIGCTVKRGLVSCILVGGDNNKIKRVGAMSTTSSDYAWCVGLGGTNNLLEDMWIWGGFRSGLEIYSPGNTVRRVLVRMDAMVNAGVSRYPNGIRQYQYNGLAGTLLENTLVLDFDVTYSTTNQAGGAYKIRSYSTNDPSTYLGCMALNINDSLNSISGWRVEGQDHIFTNCLAWQGAGQYGLINTGPNSDPNSCIATNFTGYDWNAGVQGPGFSTPVTWINSKFDATGLTYPCRPDGSGNGCTIEKRYVDGVLTADDLWPWPNQARIKTELSQLEIAPSGFFAASNPLRGFTLDTSLTNYVWNQLGNGNPYP
jgi:hypothetical protein